MTYAYDNTPEMQAISYKVAGELLARHGETLRLAALGKLDPIIMPDGSVLISVDDQVKTAREQIAAQIARLSPQPLVKIDRGYGIDAS